MASSVQEMYVQEIVRMAGHATMAQRTTYTLCTHRLARNSVNDDERDTKSCIVRV